jgi:hypothetical protein
MFTFKKLALVGLAGLTAFAMSCSDDEKEPDLTLLKKASFTLSFNGESYGDVDGAKGYKTGQLAENAAKIDLIAFAGSTVTPSNDTIYTPSSNGLNSAAFSNPNIDIMIIKFPDAIANDATTALKALKTVDDLEKQQAFMDPIVKNVNNYVDEIGIETGKETSFLLITSEGEMVAVVLSDVSTTERTAKLNITYMPEEK